MGGGISMGGLTLVLTWLKAGRRWHPWGGGQLNQRFCCSQNHWSSNTTSRLFQRQRSNYNLCASLFLSLWILRALYIRRLCFEWVPTISCGFWSCSENPALCLWDSYLQKERQEVDNVRVMLSLSPISIFGLLKLSHLGDNRCQSLGKFSHELTLSTNRFRCGCGRNMLQMGSHAKGLTEHLTTLSYPVQLCGFLVNDKC